MRIVLKELNESRIWLKMVIRAEMLPENRLELLLDECDQLCRIVSASIHTAKDK
jgi:four helix bundle protein